MSTQHSHIKNTTKKIKLDEEDESISNIAEYKKLAILKYCKENGVKKNQLDELSISNEFYKLGLFCFFIIFIINIYL